MFPGRSFRAPWLFWAGTQEAPGWPRVGARRGEEGAKGLRKVPGPPLRTSPLRMHPLPGAEAAHPRASHPGPGGARLQEEQGCSPSRRLAALPKEGRTAHTCGAQLNFIFADFE